MSENIDGAATDGFGVVFSAGKLDATAAKIRKATDDQTDAKATIYLQTALVPTDAFGTIKGGKDAADRLHTVVNEHITAIKHMGVTVADFAARVQAAGQLAEQGESDTTKASYIAAPFNSTGY